VEEIEGANSPESQHCLGELHLPNDMVRLALANEVLANGLHAGSLLLGWLVDAIDE